MTENNGNGTVDPIASFMTGFVSNMNAIAPHNVIPRMLQNKPALPMMPMPFGMPNGNGNNGNGNAVNAAVKGGITVPTSADYQKHIEGQTLGAVRGTTIFF